MSTSRREFLAFTAAATAASFGGAYAEPTKKKYRACVIGDSNQGKYGHYTHKVFIPFPQVEVVGLADPDPDGRETHARECGAARTYADYREMLATEKPDLVVIGPRWTIHHKEYLLACVEAGAHGFMEKPLCVDLAEADEMVEAARAKNLKWALAYNVRVTPAIENLKKQIFENDLIGPILEVRGRGKEDTRAGGEDLIVLGTHVFDLMIDLLGPPEWCQSRILFKGKPATLADVREAHEPLGPILGDDLVATYGFAGGVPGHFSSQTNPEEGGGRMSLTLYGSRGVVHLPMPRFPEIYWLDDPSWSPGSSGAKWVPIPEAPGSHMKDPEADRYKPIIQDLLESIEEDREPTTGLSRSRTAQEMIQSVFESHIQGGARVAIPLERRTHPLKG